MTYDDFKAKHKANVLKGFDDIDGQDYWAEFKADLHILLADERKLLELQIDEIKGWIREDGHNHCEEPTPEGWFWDDCSLCKLQKSEGKIWKNGSDNGYTVKRICPAVYSELVQCGKEVGHAGQHMRQTGGGLVSWES